MQLLGKEFINRLCLYLNSQLGVDFIDTTYKYFGKTGLFNHTYYHKGTFYDKSIQTTSLIDFVINGNNIIFDQTEQDYSNIVWYFDWNKNKQLKKHILEFYFKNNILFCPYCGLNQFQIILNDKLSSFDLDHFLPKSIFSQFALSLYNLFPVCKYCNQTLKGDKNPLQHEKCIFHPIRGWLKCSVDGNNYTLTQIHKKTFDEVFDCAKNRNGVTGDVFITNDVKYKYHIDFFELQALYLQSPYIKNDLKHIKNTYDRVKSSYATALDPDKQKCMFKNIMEGWYPNSEKEILGYSGGKFKKDVINEIAEKHF